MSFDYEAYEDIPEYFRDLPQAIKAFLVSAKMAPESWLLQPKTRGIPREWEEFQQVRGWGFLAPAGLGPIYGLGLLERGERAGYWPGYPGGDAWTYMSREQNYQDRYESLLGRALSWREMPDWVRPQLEQYRVSEAYWRAQETWSPAAMAWSAARMGLYAVPELAGGRTFGYPFAEASQRMFIASQLQPYMQGMSYEEFMKTSGGWIGQPQNLLSEITIGGGLWTGLQSAFWGVRGGISEMARGGEFATGFMEMTRRSVGTNIAQFGVGMLVGPMADWATLQMLGYPEQAYQAITRPEAVAQMGIGGAAIGFGAIINRLLAQPWAGVAGGGILGGWGQWGEQLGTEWLLRSEAMFGTRQISTGLMPRLFGVENIYAGTPTLYGMERISTGVTPTGLYGVVQAPYRGLEFERMYPGAEPRLYGVERISPTQRPELYGVERWTAGGGPSRWYGAAGAAGSILGGMAAFMGYEQFLAPTIRETYGETAAGIGGVLATFGGSVLGQYVGQRAFAAAFPSLMGGGGAAGLGASIVSGVETLGLSAVGMAAGYGATKGLEMLPGPVGDAARMWENILFGGSSALSTQVSGGTVYIPGMTRSIVQQQLWGDLSPLYAASSQAWNLYRDLYSGYQATWDAYRAKTIDYSTVAFMGGVSRDALTQALGASATLNRGILAAYGQAGALARELGDPSLATYYENYFKRTWTDYTIPSTQYNIRMEEGVVPLRDYWTSQQVSRYGPARQTFLRMEEGLVDISRPLGAGALGAIYQGLRGGLGWQGMGALTRQLETADVLTRGQVSGMLGQAFVEQLAGVGREWETSALIRQAGVGLTGVWWAAASDKIAAAALKLELTGILDVPPGYTPEDVIRLRDSWRDTGEFDWRDPTQREEGGAGRRPSPTSDYYYYSSDVLQGQHGLDEIVTRRTTIVAGETGPEHVKVTPLTGAGRSELNSQIRSIVREELALATGRSNYDLDRLEWQLSPLISKRIYRSITAKGI